MSGYFTWRRRAANHRRHLVLTLLCLVAWFPRTSLGQAPSASQSPDPSVANNSPYGKWQNGPSESATFFPIGVWLQSPNHLAEFKKIGINVFVGFWGDLDPNSLQTFADNGMALIAGQNSIGLESSKNRAIIGWNQPDEPDNAQPNGIFGHGPCLMPTQILSRYNAIKVLDTTRPVLLNFGRGVSDTAWIGRGICIGRTTSYYPLAVSGGDIISFDIYPVAEYGGRLELIPNGLDNLKTWIAMSGANKIIWNAIEAVPISNGMIPSASQERAEVWMSIIHGSQGIIYFVHQFATDGRKLMREDGIFNFPNLVNAVGSINARIIELAPVLNSPTIANGVSVTSPQPVPIDTLVKRYNGSTYVFAVAMLNNDGRATFTLPNIEGGTAEVLDESRQLPISAGVFADDFTGYGVHLYKVDAK
jgi:hypothetical protein